MSECYNELQVEVVTILLAPHLIGCGSLFTIYRLRGSAICWRWSDGLLLLLSVVVNRWSPTPQLQPADVKPAHHKCVTAKQRRNNSYILPVCLVYNK